MNIKHKLNTFLRFLEVKQVSVYPLIILVILLASVFGIYPFYKIILEKKMTINDLELVNSALNQKIEILQNVSDELADTSIYLSQLRAAIPHTNSLQQYFVEMSNVASSSGYQIQRIALSDSTEDSVHVIVRFFGVLDTFPKLVENIENMDRFTQIETVKVDLRDKQVLVEMQVRVFYL